MQWHEDRLQAAEKLERRIGRDISGPRVRGILLAAAEAQSSADVSTETRRRTTGDYLRLAGASAQDLTATMSLYEQVL